MELDKTRFVEIKKGVKVPKPRQLTSEEEAAVLRKVKMEFDPVKSEAEFAELLRQREQGLLVSEDELLRMIDELEASSGGPQKESA